MPRIIGIDLGTTFSVVASYDGERKEAVVIPNREGEQKTASVVSVADGEKTVGDIAKRGAILRPNETFMGAKRLMGVTTEDGTPVDCGVVDGMPYSPEVVLGVILEYLRNCASEQLGEEIESAVITCPAYFGDSERQAIINAGRIAGLDVKFIINEPTAACLDYGFKSGFNGRVAVFDLGGGTFDISILDVKDNVYTVLATDGDRQLGGDDFTNVIATTVLDECESQHGFRPTPGEDGAAILDLKERAERAKHDLSVRKKTVISFSARGHEVRVEVTREQFEDLIRQMIERAVEITGRTIEAAKVDTAKLTVILVGGSVRIPLVPRLLSERLGLEPVKANVGVDLGVARGAAIAAASEDIVEGECQGGLTKVVLNDVVSHGLGVETVDEEDRRVISSIIPKNTQLPVDAEDTLALQHDTQTIARIRVYQGEPGTPTDSPEAWFIGEVVLRGIPVRLPREKRIRVRFSYDRNGVLDVEGTDTVSGKSTQGRMEHRRGMTDDEVEQARGEVEGLLES